MFAAISDIHGCSNKLYRILNNLSKKKPKKTVFCGDYIDRGPNSKKVIDMMLDYSKNHDSIFLLGNHDDFFKNFVFKEKRYSPGVWNTQGGKETIKSFTGRYYPNVENSEKYIDLLEDKYLNFFRSLNKLYHVEDNHIFVHAGLRDFSLPLDKQNTYRPEINYSYIWVRDEFFNQKEPFDEKVIVHGHTPVFILNRFGITPEKENVPFFRYSRDNKLISIDIDTGACYGEKLSCLLIENNEYNYLSE
ncbi:MAG: metallophosphoesterase family protein [Thermotogota bacterium]